MLVGRLGYGHNVVIPCCELYWADYCKQCRRCVVSKAKKVKTTMGTLLAKRPLEVLAIDFTLLEPSSSGIENALVLTDVFTKYTQVIPTKDQKARTVAKVLVKDWFVRFGVPQRIHSDQGRNFESTLVKELCAIYGIAKSRTTPIAHRATHRQRGSIGRYMIDCEPCPTNRRSTGRIISRSWYTAITVHHIRRLHTRPIT